MSKSQRLFVVSDLHLSGSGDQKMPPMCSRESQRHLAKFFCWVATQHASECPAHLVLNGDIIDFLADSDDAGYLSFSGEARGLRKLRRLLDRDQEPAIAAVFDGLRKVLSVGASLTMLLGNHDLELCLPAVCAELRDCLCDEGVRFIFDNQALVIGPVLIEHGNRYDAWNYVDHDTLRALRSAGSRREGNLPVFHPPPGSELVARVINEVKQVHPFVELLKPETELTLPLLAILGQPRRSTLELMCKALVLYGQQQLRQLAQRVGTANHGQMAAGSEPNNYSAYQRILWTADEETLRRPVAPDDKHDDVALRDTLRSSLDATKDMLNDLIQMPRDHRDGNMAIRHNLQGAAELTGAFLSNSWDDKSQRLLSTIQTLYRNNPLCLHTDHEVDPYLKHAKESILRGYKVVIYGHTHLMKQMELAGGRYLNTGTWADLMLVSPVMMGSDQEAARREFMDLAQALGLVRQSPERKESPSASRYRRQLPSYAEIVLGADGRNEAKLFLFESPENPRCEIYPNHLKAIADAFPPASR